MKKTYNTPEFISINLQTNDIMNSSVEGFSLFGTDGVGSGDEQGFNFPISFN